MVEGAGSDRLLREPPLALGIADCRRRQDLDGDISLWEARVLGSIHLAHAACAELPTISHRAESAWCHTSEFRVQS